MTVMAKLRSDAALLALEQQLDEAAADLPGIVEWINEISDLVDEEVWRFATWPDNQEVWSRADARAYVAMLSRVEHETEVGRSYVRAFDALDLCHARTDPLCQLIHKLPATTEVGKAIKTKAASILSGEWPPPRPPTAAPRLWPAEPVAGVVEHVALFHPPIWGSANGLFVQQYAMDRELGRGGND